MLFWKDQRLSFTRRECIQQRDELLILPNFYTRDLSRYDLTKNTIRH